jgi:hypothetical protein
MKKFFMFLLFLLLFSCYDPYLYNYVIYTDMNKDVVEISLDSWTNYYYFTYEFTDIERNSEIVIFQIDDDNITMLPTEGYLDGERVFGGLIGCKEDVWTLTHYFGQLIGFHLSTNTNSIMSPWLQEGRIPSSNNFVDLRR